MGDKGGWETRETRPREGGHTIQQRETRRETRGDKRRQGETRPSGRQTHHPTKGHKKGDKGRQGETRPSGRRTHHPTKGNKKGDKGRQGETRPSEGGHTIQHQGGHLKKALRTPNSTLLAPNRSLRSPPNRMWSFVHLY